MLGLVCGTYKMLNITENCHLFFIFKKLRTLENNLVTRYCHEFNFDSEEEVVTNNLGQIMLIGINLPDTKNVLTESALKKLSDSFKSFECSNKFSVAVLHGCRGNFCRGLVSTNKTTILGQNLIKTLHTLKKPVIGALDGYTTNFGFHLAVMCDMRAMEETCVAGIDNEIQNTEILPITCERLILNIGLARTFELICSRRIWSASKCMQTGFITQVADSGCALGQAISWAQSIAFHNPLKSLLQDKTSILSCLRTQV